MSFQAMTWAVEQKVPALQKLVLLMLANRLNHDTGKCIPKIKTLADECGMSESSVKTAMKGLSEAGLITIVPRFQESVQLPNAYVLHVGVGCQKTPGGLPCNPGWVATHLQNQELNQELNPALTGVDSESRFNAFWECYPKKVGKDGAHRKWKIKVKTAEVADEIMKALKIQKDSEKWTQSRGQFVPNPETWLNQGRWKDEMPGEGSAVADWSKGAV
jgi:hypothetical protein